MRFKTILLPIGVVAGVMTLSLLAMHTPAPQTEPAPSPVTSTDLEQAISDVDAALERLWSEKASRGAESSAIPPDSLDPLTPAPLADDLKILRRLSLALHGTIPSLEEIRQFEADTRPGRLLRWTAKMLEDRRFADYFAERLARAYVGVEEGEFIFFRRDRFKSWLSQQIRDHRPYDEIVRNMIAARGVWTGKGEANFLTGALANEKFDVNKLTARTSRAFLGQRIDCAQCHDHPFDHWTQAQFEGLAAHYGQLSMSLAGVVDDPNLRFSILGEDDEPLRSVDPAVPFHPEWVPAQGTYRERLADWIIHPKNRRFERAIANRVWGLLFGRPFAHRIRIHEQDEETGKSEWSWTVKAVDDLPDPEDPRYGSQLEVLDLLGQDFREHGCDLRRLILVITGSKAFRLESYHPETADIQPHLMTDAELDALRLRQEQMESRWSVFPLVRLRPEQVIGAMLQANYVVTIDQNSHLIVRAMRFFREQDFVDQFGDPGVDELEDRAGTIQQALLRMNGSLARELTEEEWITAPGQIKRYSSTPQRLLENIFLACLSRRPSQDELAFFLEKIQGRSGKVPHGTVQDLYWIMFNSPEFSWNH